MGCRLFLVLCLAGAAGCASHDSGAIEVEVQIAANVPSDCITVAAWNTPGQEATANFARGSATQYKAAVYPGNGLSGTVTVVARGFTGSCGSNLSALSAQTSATFNDPAPLVTLVLEPASCPGCDGGGGDGGGGDGGPPPDGGIDAGGDSGSPDGGGSDGGADSGSDAGRGDDGGCHGADSGERCGFGWGLCAEDSTCVENFPFPPSNFTKPYPPISPPIVLNCGKSYIDTTGPGQAPNFSNWCGNPLPGWLDAAQGGGAATAVVLAMSSFELAAGSQLIVDGGRSVILAVFGDAGVDGTLFTGGAGGYSGPGANSAACGLGETGQIASGTGANNPGSGGGGGGGLGTAGAPGGLGNSNNGGPGGDGGALSGTSTVQPLVAGCSGGDGGLSPNQPGFGVAGGGGGAVQVTAANLVTVNGTVTSPGGGGGGGGGNTGNHDGPGAGGGGSGGAILLEASNVILQNAHLTANGGSGGGGGDDNNAGGAGSDGSTANATVANGGGGGGAGGNGGKGGAGATLPTAGSPGNGSWGSGGGGGGAVGRIWLRAADGGCTINGGTVSPAATSNGAPGCP